MGSWHACTKRNTLCSSASSLNTAFRFTHGSHHDAQKLRTHAPEAAVCFGWREEESGHNPNLSAEPLIQALSWPNFKRVGQAEMRMQQECGSD